MNATDPRPPEGTATSPARLLPLLVILVLVCAAVGVLRLRDRPAPRVGPRANLQLVRIDDDANPLVTERAPPLPGVSVTLVREQYSSQARSRAPTTYAQIVLPQGPARKEATESVTAWLASVQRPPGTRFALGEQTRRTDDDEPPTTKVWLRSYLLTGEPAITTVDVVDARVERQSYDNRPAVLVKLSPSGAKRFGDVTREWQRRRLAIVLDDVVMSAPMIMSPIEGGQVTITMGQGGDADAEAQRLASALRP